MPHLTYLNLNACTTGCKRLPGRRWPKMGLRRATKVAGDLGRGTNRLSIPGMKHTSMFFSPKKVYMVFSCFLYAILWRTSSQSEWEKNLGYQQ